ncbi:hypothetical protein AMTRI_Chr04g248490 [Amborella trichopoda]
MPMIDILEPHQIPPFLWLEAAGAYHQFFLSWSTASPPAPSFVALVDSPSLSSTTEIREQWKYVSRRRFDRERGCHVNCDFHRPSLIGNLHPYPPSSACCPAPPPPPPLEHLPLVTPASINNTQDDTRHPISTSCRIGPDHSLISPLLQPPSIINTAALSSFKDTSPLSPSPTSTTIPPFEVFDTCHQASPPPHHLCLFSRLSSQGISSF